MSVSEIPASNISGKGGVTGGGVAAINDRDSDSGRVGRISGDVVESSNVSYNGIFVGEVQKFLDNEMVTGGGFRVKRMVFFRCKV